MIRVLVVDDSPVVRKFLTRLLDSEPGILVIGQACDGVEAIEAVRAMHPDVVTMDVNMPRMDGFEATRIIMETSPVPIVIVTGSFDPREVAKTFRAMEAGAVAVVARPAGIGHPDHENAKRVLVRYIRAMSQLRLVRRWPRPPRMETSHRVPESESRPACPEVRVVAIGASTGGPAVIQRILASLPGEFPVPVLIVQHMARGFIAGFAAWLAQTSPLPVKVAVHGELVRPGSVYVAPDGFNMGLSSDRGICLEKGVRPDGHCPSVAHLFRSIADGYGEAAVGILLTGMGKDGAEELLAMKKRGALTIAQDEASSVVYGMPGAAKDLNAASYVLPPDYIIEMLKGLVRRYDGRKGSASPEAGSADQNSVAKERGL